MADYCYTPIDLVAIRVTLLEENGSPYGGASNLYVTEDPIQLSLKPRVEQGSTSVQKNGRGIVCSSKTARSTITGYDLAGTFCRFEVELLQLMFGGTLLTGGTGGTETIGIADPDPDSQRQFGVCIEAWAAAYNGAEVQGTFPAASGAAAYIQYAWPRVQCMPGAETMQEGVIVQPWEGIATSNPALGPGPNNDWPATLNGPMGKWVTNAKPTGACGATTAIS